ncbi:hypothetical protein [Halomarina ordinaria]|uniref:Uncharacterized protein n=1 Tax=Halomarina ordinaria TaxID=3033939 RepID=A0ABD5U6R7_9EURY|nr:hypothetical protein [Halomarina sp. PSRA2]
MALDAAASATDLRTALVAVGLVCLFALLVAIGPGDPVTVLAVAGFGLSWILLLSLVVRVARATERTAAAVERLADDRRAEE